MKVRRGGRYSEQALYGEAFLEHFGSKNKKSYIKNMSSWNFAVRVRYMGMGVNKNTLNNWLRKS